MCHNDLVDNFKTLRIKIHLTWCPVKKLSLTSTGTLKTSFQATCHHARCSELEDALAVKDAIILALRSHRFSFHGATTGERVHLRTPFCNSFFLGEKLNCGQYSSQFSVSVW
ncbi:hypothetical protein LAZ67_9000205 [Cordylochernes scorpioides]|uniref:Uncharacterized protein n=1 Tax=Cordylochernes scorpioides TaxID=51811 RepID=A0ABY6KSC0_9ARAC|nr:hypothetical protein LAZ67_9000205 [Cordylochernes scorpioides]